MSSTGNPQRHAHQILIWALLASIAMTIGVGPDAPVVRWFWLLLPIGAAFVLLRRRRWLALALALIASVIGVSSDGALSWFAGAVAFGFTAAVLLVQVFRHRVVTGETISAALSAYLLLGVTFAMVFGGIHELDPDAIVGVGHAKRDVPDMLYFSFVTLTTLGYGDLAPASGSARGVAVLEALIGQLFLVAIVAQLVGRHASSRSDPPAA